MTNRVMVDVNKVAQSMSGDELMKNAVIIPVVDDAGMAAIAGPTAGTLVYNTTAGKLYIHNGTDFKAVTSG